MSGDLLAKIDLVLQTALSDLESTTALPDLQGRILGLRDTFEVDHLVYHSVNSTGDQYAALTYTDAWVERYISHDYARLDPIVLSSYRSFGPLNWKSLDWSRKPTRNFFEEARGHGVGTQGVSIPIRGPGGQFAIFTVNHSTTDEKWDLFRSRAQHSLLLAAHFTNEKALSMEAHPEANVQRTLSPREIDALSHLAVGRSRAEIADRLDISEHTLRVYIESARNKLGAINTVHAVARALAQGQIVI